MRATPSISVGAPEHGGILTKRTTSSGEFASLLVVALVVVAVLFALRSPTILFAHEMNVDESQMLSQGMKFLSDPIPWRSVDGTSGGPLNSYLILLFLLIGFRASYELAHVLATGLVCVQALIAYVTLRRMGSRRMALWGITPLIFCYGFGDGQDYLHYSSELLPELCLAAGFFLFVMWVGKRLEEGISRPYFLFITGFALGLAPWCKLQALPMAVAIGATVLLAIARLPADTRYGHNLPTELQSFCAGAFVPGAAILVFVARAGAMKDFWYSYVLGNLNYAGEPHLSLVFEHLGDAFAQPELLPLVVLVSVAVVLFASLSCTKRKLVLSTSELWIFGGASVWLAAAIAAICRPAQFFPHYTIFLLHPLTYLGVGLISKVRTRIRDKFLTRLNVVSMVAAGALVATSLSTQVLRIMVTRAVSREPDASEKIVTEVQKMNRDYSVHSIAIWGWTPGVYVLTGIPPATRDSIGHFVITQGPLETYFRSRFVNDLRQAKPDLFIDAVSRGAFLWTWKAAYDGYESDPALRDFIDTHYILAQELELVPGSKPVRFYRKRERPGTTSETPLATPVHSGVN